MDVTTSTPAQIDTEIARLSGVIAGAETVFENGLATIARIDAAQATYERDYPWNSQEKRAEAVAAVSKADAAAHQARTEMAPLVDEFVARGGWTRFYLVVSAGGHVHPTRGCTTCFPTTKYAWLTDYSGMTHEALVEEAGAMACTVCFPDAPVEVLNRATRIKYESAEAKAKREEREAKAAAKAAAEVVVEGLVESGRVQRARTFKTVRAVTNAIAAHLSSLCVYGMDHPTATEWVANIATMREALTAKGAEYDYDKALAAARKRHEREARRYGNADPSAKF